MVRAQHIRERWHLARSVLRYGGARRFFGLIIRGILKPLVERRTFCFFERDLIEPISPFEASIPLEIRLATDADFERFHDVLLRERVDASEIEQRRANGDLCFLGISGSRLIHFTWLIRRPIWLPLIGATLQLGADEAYVHFSYTDPAMRGRAVQPAVVNFMHRWEQTAGIRHHLYFVMGHNVSAMKIASGPHASSAARRSRTVQTVRLLGVPGFLATGLGGAERPRLKPGPHADLGRVGLWIRP